MGSIQNSGQTPLNTIQNVQAPLGPPPQVAPPESPGTLQPPKAPPLPSKTQQGVSLTDPDLIEQVIDNAPDSQEISDTEQNLKPLKLNVQEKISSSLSFEQELKQVKSNLKSVNTDDRSGLNPVFKQQALKDTLSLGQTQIEQHDVERMHREVDLKPLFQSTNPQNLKRFDNSYMDYMRGGEPQQYLQNSLTQSLKRLDKAGASLFNSKSEIKKVVAQTQQEMQQMVARLSSQSDLSVFLGAQSEAELRQLVSEAVGQLKGYTPEETLELSKKKQAFVQAVVQGIQAGLKQQDTLGLNGQGEPVTDDQPGELHLALKAIQQDISDFLEPHGPDSDLIWNLALKSNAELRTQMQEIFGTKKEVVFESMLQSIQQSLPNQVSGRSVNIPTKSGNMDVPETLELNGVRYGRPKYLAEGGFAEVVRYTNLNDSEDHVVVKIPKVVANLSGLSPEQIRAETVQETITHREIQGQGHTNIIGLKGAVKGPDDQLLIVMESAPQGNLYRGAQTLLEVTQSGLISEDTRQLLGTFFLRGVIQGTQHMQETRQAHHADFKTPNILIGSDGEAKLTDFGTSGLGLTRQSTKRDVDNPRWLAPELLETDFSTLQQQAIDFGYDQVYQNFQNQIEQVLNLDVTYTKDNGQIMHLNRDYNDQNLQIDLNKALLLPGSPDKAQIMAIKAQLQQEQPGLDDETVTAQALEAYKAQVPERIEQVTRRVSLDWCLAILGSQAQDQLDLSEFDELRDNIQSLRQDKHPLIEAYKEEHKLTLQQAKMDTWGLGIVATELLLAPTTAKKEDSTHFQKLDLLNSFNVRIENSIKAFARNNERLSGLSEGLNVRTLARELESDPRFAGEAYGPMFRVLMGPEMPLGPKDESPEALEAYQKDVVGYRLEHNLSPEAFAQKQGEYTQALQQFQAVLNLEFDMGVTARDKLINGFLHPDPEKRITMTGALESSLFQDARLDMPELKQLWVELNKEKPNQAEIQRLVGILGE